MNRNDERLNRLAAKARRAAAPPPKEMPLGSPTRVLTTLRERREPAALWEPFALRAVLAAACVLLLCLWLAPNISTKPAVSVADELANDIFNQALIR